MKINKTIISAIVASVIPLFTGAVNANSITIDAANTTSSSTVQFLTTGNQTAQATIDTAILQWIGSATELYKQDVGATRDVGTFKDSYSTVLSPSNDPSKAVITYGSGNSINSNPIFFLVKDGNHSPAWYLVSGRKRDK